MVLLEVAIASTRAGRRELHPVVASVSAAIFGIGVGVGACQSLWFREGTTAGRRALGMQACTAAASNKNETDEELDEWYAVVGVVAVVGVGRGGALLATLVAVTGRSLQLRVGNAAVKTFGIVRVSGAGGFGVPHTFVLDYANTFSIIKFTKAYICSI